MAKVISVDGTIIIIQNKHFIRLYGCNVSLYPLEIKGNESLSDIYSYEIKCLSKLTISLWSCYN